MKKLILLGLMCAATAGAAYEYYYFGLFWGYSYSTWGSAGYWDWVAPNVPTLLSNIPSDGQGEVQVVMARDKDVFNELEIYLHATPDAFPGGIGNGNYDVISFIPSYANGGCTLTVSAPGSMTQAPCGTRTNLRVVYSNQFIVVYIDGVKYIETSATGRYGGAPAVSGSLNAIYSLFLGPLDTVPPVAPVVTYAAFPLSVSLQWPAVQDDPNGIGVWAYKIYRDGTYIGTAYGPSYTDTTVRPGTTYSYKVAAVDYHQNSASSSPIALTTPSDVRPINPQVPAVDPRRVGVRRMGSYWGASGENVDLLSGNLNFTLPLLHAMGRGGWGVDFALSYNSQLWRQDSGGTWKLGGDVGYGYGWQLMAGSVTPYWADYWTFDHYQFTDSTGAQYRLDVNNNGIWTSHEGIYVEYDAAAKRLYFPDGSFWYMGATSSALEPDGGTLYPTLMQDTSGSRITIHYQTGAGSTIADSSARISSIADVRSASTYQFVYTSETVPHLTQINCQVNSGESYSFAYTANYGLVSPLPAGGAYGTTTALQQTTKTSVSQSHLFENTIRAVRES